MNTCQQLEDIGDPVFSLPLNGELIEVKRLKPRHIAEAVAWMRAERLREWIKTLPPNAIMNPIHAEAMAKIHTTPISDTDVLLDYQGRMVLAWKAIQSAKPGVTLESVMDKLQVDDSGEFFRLVGRISGIYKEQEEAAKPDPLGTNERTYTASSSPELGVSNLDTLQQEQAVLSTT